MRLDFKSQTLSLVTAMTPVTPYVWHFPGGEGTCQLAAERLWPAPLQTLPPSSFLSPLPARLFSSEQRQIQLRFTGLHTKPLVYSFDN